MNDHEDTDSERLKREARLLREEADTFDQTAHDLEKKAQALRADARHLEDEAHEFVFFVGQQRFVTHHEHLTGREIKAMVPGWQPPDGLELEGDGHEPNRLIGDNDTVHFRRERPTHFIKVPPATFGVGR
jgi:hypothetical protein